ncbi:MAG TPA: ketopantoate reductase family protein [Terriglobales bacterium]|nr:ketopantoate reductase family protein [Terriglobales bacterium]
MQEKEWPRIAVVGAGAVGCYFGGMLARAGAPVTLIGRAPHVEAINRDGLFIDSIRFKESVSISASTEIGAARGAQLVLFSVKTVDTEGTAKLLAPYLAPDTIVVSLQNGVDNAERIDFAAGIQAIPAVVYIAAAMIGLGRVKHSGRGDLIIGKPSGNPSGNPSPNCDAGEAELEEVAAAFTRASVPCRISKNITAELWEKLIMNCAYNALSALSRMKYGRIAQDPGAIEVMKCVVIEAVRVAGAAGVQVSESSMTEAVLKLGKAMPEALSSTAQDIARGKPTEIDSLNGFLVRKGAEKGVPTPVNQTLYSLVKLLEQAPSVG